MSDGKRQKLDELLGGILQKGKRTIEKLGKNVNKSTLRPQKPEKPPRPRKEANPGRGKKTEKARRTQKPEKPVRAKKPKRPGRGGQGLLAVARDGLIYQNPTLVQLLGMCPTLAISTSLKTVGMGLAATAVLLAPISISLLRKFIRRRPYIVIYGLRDGYRHAHERLPASFQSRSACTSAYRCQLHHLARASLRLLKQRLRSAFDGLSWETGFTVALKRCRRSASSAAAAFSASISLPTCFRPRS